MPNNKERIVHVWSLDSLHMLHGQVNSRKTLCECLFSKLYAHCSHKVLCEQIYVYYNATYCSMQHIVHYNTCTIEDSNRKTEKIHIYQHALDNQ